MLLLTIHPSITPFQVIFLSVLYIETGYTVAQAKMARSSLNSNNGDDAEREDGQSYYESVRELAAKYYSPNEDFDKELQALFTTTRKSIIHQLLRNSCVPLGYIVVYFCASMIPDPPSSSDSTVCFESSFVE